MRLSPTAQPKQSDRRLSPQPHDENDQPKMNHNTFVSSGVSRHGANKDGSPRGNTSTSTGLFTGFKNTKEQSAAASQKTGLNVAGTKNVARMDVSGVDEHGRTSSLDKGKLSGISKAQGETRFDETINALKVAPPMRPSSFSTSDPEDKMLLFPRKGGDSTVEPVDTSREIEATFGFADIGREYVQDAAASQHRDTSKSTLDSTKQHANTPPRPIVQRRKTNLDGVSLSSSDHQQPYIRSRLPAPLPLSRPHQRSASPNKIPRAPRQTLETSSTHSSNSKRRLSKDASMNLHQSTSRSISSGQGSGSDGHGSAKKSPSSWKWGPKADAMEQEQALFEERLCEDSHGVAVRKINQKGKSNLRYVKCITLESWQSNRLMQRDKRNRVLTWGKKKEVRLPLDRFIGVRKGKTTDRARRNPSPSYRVLSLITDDPEHPSLDIEAPTRSDRDKFSRAFARFLEVPLVEEGLSSSQSVTQSIVDPFTMTVPFSSASTAISAPERVSMPNLRLVEKQRNPRDRSFDDERAEKVEPAGSRNDVGVNKQDCKPTISHAAVDMESKRKDEDVSEARSDPPEDNWQVATNASSVRGSELSSTHNAAGSHIPRFREDEEVCGADGESQVSSLTGAGFDQEIVEELHQALNDLRAELEESRAEAARAVKVAEQAIQSAENSNSKDWNATVTHKAAEAAALAQKKSAEAMAKQRLAEEMLEGEKRNVSFWRSKAEAFEEQAGVLQTKAAAAEVKKAELMEKLECERRRNVLLMERMQAPSLTFHDSRFEKSTVTREADDGRSTHLHSNHSGSHQHLPGESDDGESFLQDTFPPFNGEATNEFGALPPSVRRWADEAVRVISSHRSEIDLLRHRVALETSTRRKLLEEIQDLRGSVRVYCRPRACATAGKRLLSFPSQDSLALDRGSGSVPLSFKFDRVFQPDMKQNEVYSEIEDACLGVLDGYNICFMAHGQTGSGKTHTLLGDIKSDSDGKTLDKLEICNFGIQLQAIRQLLSVSEERRDSYVDSFSLSVLEVHNERLCDLIVGTEIGETCGEHCFEDGKMSSRKVSRSKKSFDDGSSSLQPNSVSSKVGLTKLEIRTSQDGDTTVQGLLSVKLQSFGDAIKVWEQCLMQRAKRLLDQGINVEEYNASGHMIATLTVVSTKIQTGVSTLGKLKCVDLAGADLMPPPQAIDIKQNMAVTEAFASSMGNKEWKFRNKSLATFGEVANCRSNFMRSVPYRNSTLTHLLRDDLESDTKLYFFVCVSSNVDDAHETACSLRFATRMAQITIGKATKHTLSQE